MGLIDSLIKYLSEKTIKWKDGKFKLMGREGVLIPLDVFVEQRKKFGSAFHKELGIMTGKMSMEVFKRSFSLTKPNIKTIIKTIEILGWGEIVDIVSQKKYFKAVIKSNIANSWIKHYPLSKESVCDYLSGTMESSSKGFVENLKLKEVQCIAKGDKYCVFEGGIKDDTSKR